MIEIVGYLEFAEPCRVDDAGREIYGRFNVVLNGATTVSGLVLTRKTRGDRAFQISAAAFSRSARVSFTNALAAAIVKAVVRHRFDCVGSDGRAASVRKSQISAGRGASSNASEAG